MSIIDVGMFEGMMPCAEVTEVVDPGPAAFGVVVVVVDLAAVHRHAASGESAVLIAGAEEPPHALGRCVGIGLGDHALGIEEESAPAGVASGQVAGDIGVEWTVAVELGDSIVDARESGGRDRDLNARLDVVEPAAVRLARIRGEQEVGEEIGTDLIDRAGVGGDVLDVVAVLRAVERVDEFGQRVGREGVRLSEDREGGVVERDVFRADEVFGVRLRRFEDRLPVGARG
ncbi:hypothetical protein GCM10010489_39010 [Microbacterium saperdae]|uniref:Uncharacterized protein n=1 Tax=Microbacterium saperdae TaxID=69368 RepID=A0A543BKU4_9MICO|nr:hypothetical protein FB560_1069 [Microbacterium saperdae]GGM63635.1 hypothetical protein GCM10010489_39010 [Microbacterium saperdae]